MSRRGVLLVNLGSPASPSIRDVRRYLREFLMDRRVLDAPYLIRLFVVRALILPFRPKQSAEAYQKIWTREGSPLLVISRKVQEKLQSQTALPVELAMRYGVPSIWRALVRLHQIGVKDLLLIPLFPHYAMSSYETAVERARALQRRVAPGLRLAAQPPYFDHPDYITALSESAADPLRRGSDHLLFSFHGVPERHLRKSDPTKSHCLSSPDCCQVSSPAQATCYRAQCLRTAQAFVARTHVPSHSVAFQSRLGRDPWLRPYTDQELTRLAQDGVERLSVICPAFVSDCLETLEEIGMRGRSLFLEAGGKDFQLIPCLNDHPLWITALRRMVERFESDPTGVRNEE
jgi:ferrochelatase